MAKFVLTDASVTVNGVNLSDHVQKVTVETTKDDVEVTSMGATYKAYLGGLGDANIKVTFFSDFAASSIHATLFPLSTTSTPFPVIVKPVRQCQLPIPASGYRRSYLGIPRSTVRLGTPTRWTSSSETTRRPE